MSVATQGAFIPKNAVHVYNNATVIYKIAQKSSSAHILEFDIMMYRYEVGGWVYA